MEKLIWKTGNHLKMILIQESENTELVVLKWIFGKPTLLTLKLLPILAQSPDKQDVKGLIVVTMPLEIDTTEFVTKMDVISTLSD